MKKVLIIAVFMFTAMSFTIDKNAITTNTSIDAEYPTAPCIAAAYALDAAVGGLSYEKFNKFVTDCEAM